MMQRNWRHWAIVMLGLAAIGAAAPATFHIGGSGVSGSDWSVEQLRSKLADEIKPIDYTGKSGKHTFNCVPLVSVLKVAGVQTDMVMKKGADPKAKNPQMRMAVVVRGRDGYTVAFSMAELMPKVGNRAVWLALDEDDKPLAENDRPIRLIVPEDHEPARGVHEVESIDVVDASAAATQPGNP